MKLKIRIHHLTISDFLFFFITPVVTWHLIVFTAHCASLTVVYWSKWLDPQSVFLHGGINGHLMLFMSYVLPIYELWTGKADISINSVPIWSSIRRFYNRRSWLQCIFK